MRACERGPVGVLKDVKFPHVSSLTSRRRSWCSRMFPTRHAFGVDVTSTPQRPLATHEPQPWLSRGPRATWHFDLVHDADRLALGLIAGVAVVAVVGVPEVERTGVCEVRGGQCPSSEPDEGGVDAFDSHGLAGRKDRLENCLSAYHRRRAIHYQLTLQQRDKHCGLGGESGSGGLGQPTPGSVRGRRGSWGTLRRLARFGMIRGRGGAGDDWRGVEGWRVPTVGPSDVGERENRPGELS